MLLQSCAAFLLPAQWEEPFGIVMLEAMACGTPVIGFRRGAIPDIIVDGVTGFVVDDFNQMADKVRDIGGIDRLECRKAVERNYSSDAIVDLYVDLYRSVQRNAGLPRTEQSRVERPTL